VSFGLAAASAVGATVLFVRDAQDEPTTEVSFSLFDPGTQGFHVSLRHAF
jgi:hypothetical protein